MYNVLNLPAKIEIGHLGEANYRTVEFDVNDLIKDYEGGEVVLNYRRPDGWVYTVPSTSYADGVLTWTVSDIDLAVAGVGSAEIEFKYNDSVIGKSNMFTVVVANAVMGAGDIPTPPTPYEPTYASLPDKPSINGHELVGDMTSAELGISYTLTAQDKQEIANIVLSELTMAETQEV